MILIAQEMCHVSKIRNRVVLTYVVIYRTRYCRTVESRDRKALGRGRAAAAKLAHIGCCDTVSQDVTAAIGARGSRSFLCPVLR